MWLCDRIGYQCKSSGEEMARKKELIMVGIVDAEGYELDNRVYGRKGSSPTQRHGNARISVLRKYKHGKERNNHNGWLGSVSEERQGC